MTDWIKWDGGECPIPDAKAGEYKVKYRNKAVSKPSLDAEELCDWFWGSLARGSDIIAYRLIEKEQSDLDWLEGLVQIEFDHQNEKQPNFASVAAREAYRAVLDLIKARKEAKS